MKILMLICILSLTSCVNVNVETKDAAHEASELIRDGVKGGIVLYKESKKDSMRIADSTSAWSKIKSKFKKNGNK